MIAVTCSQCGLTIKVPASVQGSKGVCFGCGAKLFVPVEDRAVKELELRFSEGTRISDRYIVAELLGKGGMGAIYRAHDDLVGEDVALKFMHPRLLRTQHGQQLFIREAQVARRLRHENIVAVHDVARTGEGVLYLSMELCEGRSLRRYLSDRRPKLKLLPIRLVVRLMDQMLAALEYAHKTVVHRDVKPENVMMMVGDRVKVLDFGLAKAVDAEAEVSGEQALPANRVMGTKAYAAPEQQKHQDVDLRADLYSMGLIFHELLTLRTPMDKPVTVEKVRGDVAPGLLAVRERAIQEDRGSRWQSATAFREALLTAYSQAYERVTPADDVSDAGTAIRASTMGMVFLPGGSFLMGSDGAKEEQPEHEAEVEPFYIDVHPVTVQQYAAFLDATGNTKPRFWGQESYSGPEQPVVGVSWEDAQAYARWAGKQLPTEAQWEFAARGQENRPYPWGNEAPNAIRANYGEQLSMVSIVGMHDDGVTPDGVHDLAGNVYEWTSCRFLPYGKTDPEEKRRTARGGSWQSPPEALRCSHRKGFFPESRETWLGFRCVLPAPDA